MANAANARGRPAALYPPFVPGRLYRIYNTNNPASRGILVEYKGPASPLNDDVDLENNDNGVENFHDFTGVVTDVDYAIYVNPLDPTYGTRGRYVGRAVAAERNATARSTSSLVAPASSHLCSLPGCTNPAPYMCGKCSSAFYCSPEHQKADWKRHKPECRALSAKAGGRRKSRRSKRSTRKTKRRHH